MKKSLEFILSLVTAERERQVAKGYDAAHDAKHTQGELAAGAAAYALPPYLKLEYAAKLFPWVGYYRKESSRVSEVVKGIAMLVAEAQRLFSAPQFGIATKLITELNGDNNANFQVNPAAFITLAAGVEEMLNAGADFTEEAIYDIATGGGQDSGLHTLPGFGEVARSLNTIFDAGSPEGEGEVSLHFDAKTGVPDLALDTTGKPANEAEATDAATRFLAAFNSELGIALPMMGDTFATLAQGVGQMLAAGFDFTDEAVAAIAKSGTCGNASRTPGWHTVVAALESHVKRADQNQEAAWEVHYLGADVTTPGTATDKGSTDPAEAVGTTGAKVSPTNPGGGFGQAMGDAAVVALAPNGNAVRQSAPDPFLADEPRPGSDVTAAPPAPRATEDGLAPKRRPGRPPVKR